PTPPQSRPIPPSLPPDGGSPAPPRPPAHTAQFHRLASRRASPSLRGRRSARTTQFTDSPRGARRRASAAAARLALPLAQIPLAGVGQHGHHELLGGELRGDGARSERRGAGGDA